MRDPLDPGTARASQGGLGRPILPDGLIAHGSHDSEGHLVVNNVWESRGHLDRFVEERLQTAIGEALGDRANEPEIVERELHSFYAHEPAVA